MANVTVTPTAAAAVALSAGPLAVAQSWPVAARAVCGVRNPLVLIARGPIPPGNVPPSGSLSDTLRNQWEPVWLVAINIR